MKAFSIIMIIIGFYCNFAFARPEGRFNTDNALVTPELVKRVDLIEKKFSDLDVDELLKRLDTSELDSLKNDFLFYSRVIKLNGEDDLVDGSWRIPEERESFASGEVRERIKYNLTQLHGGGKSDKVVFIKFKELLFKVGPAFDKMIAERQQNAEKQAVIDSAKNEKLRAAQDKILNTPQCKKLERFIEYCDLKKNMTEVQFSLDKEKKLNKRTGTENIANIRNYTSVIMSHEEQINKVTNDFNKLKASSPQLANCQIKKIDDQTGLRFIFAEKTNSIIKDLKKKSCQIDDWQPDSN